MCTVAMINDICHNQTLFQKLHSLTKIVLTIYSFEHLTADINPALTPTKAN